MKRKIFGVAVLALGVAFFNTEAKADNLLGDIDGGAYSDISGDGYWLGNDTNPDFVSPSSEGVEEQWLEALLQMNVDFVTKHEDGGLGSYDGLLSWSEAYDPGFEWDYVIAKVGAPGGPNGDEDPTLVFSHYAFGDNDLNDDLFSLPDGFSFDHGLSHLTFFTGTPDRPPTDPVPEPTTMLLFGAGLAGLAGVRRKVRR